MMIIPVPEGWNRSPHEHHYVPRWYQKRFLTVGQQKLWYLDVNPEKVTVNERISFTRPALRSMYPAQCFYFDDLYLLRFGKYITDVIEKSVTVQVGSGD